MLHIDLLWCFVAARERERKMKSLRQQKEEFKEGFWNANSILLGGLGRDPVLEGEEDINSLAPGKIEWDFSNFQADSSNWWLAM